VFQVGDSVVSKGRETLERTIRFIEDNAKPSEDSDEAVGSQSQTQKPEDKTWASVHFYTFK
jgi:hypothetical protein